MISLDEENAIIFQDRISNLLPLIQGEYAEILERVSMQIVSKLCDEGDLTFALCILRNIAECHADKISFSKASDKTDSSLDNGDKLVVICNDLINLISLLLSQQGLDITNGVRR